MTRQCRCSVCASLAQSPHALCVLLCFVDYLFEAIGTAFAVLSDADKRAHYDRWGDDDGPQVSLLSRLFILQA